MRKAATARNSSGRAWAHIAAGAAATMTLALVRPWTRQAISW